MRTRVKTNSSTEIAGHPSDDLQSNFEVVIRKIDLITTGLPEYVSKQLTDLRHLSSENALTIVNFILTQKTEINISDIYKLNMISTLVLLSNSLNHKSFRDMKRDDILIYLDSLRKNDASDPLHKWIGSYNVKRQRLITFFRWFYNTNKSPSDRQTPEFMKQIPILKRREQSINNLQIYGLMKMSQEITIFYAQCYSNFLRYCISFSLHYSRVTQIFALYIII